LTRQDAIPAGTWNVTGRGNGIVALTRNRTHQWELLMASHKWNNGRTDILLIEPSIKGLRHIPGTLSEFLSFCFVLLFSFPSSKVRGIKELRIMEG
jgi:hypothetical protein